MVNSENLNFAPIVANSYKSQNLVGDGIPHGIKIDYSIFNDVDPKPNATSVAPAFASPPYIASSGVLPNGVPVNTHPVAHALGSIIGNVGGTFLGALVSGAVQTMPTAVTNQLGNASVTVVDSAIVAFWKKHKVLIISILVCVPVAITIIVKFIYKPKFKSVKKW